MVFERLNVKPKKVIIMKMIRISFAIILAGSALLVACKKDFKKIIQEDTSLESKAKIRVYNGALNTNRNYVFVDGAPVSGVVFAYLGLFPASGQYAVLEPGNRNIVIKDTLPATTQNPTNISASFAAGKYYTIFIYDTTNSVKYKMVEDEIVVPSDTSARLRFANLLYSSGAIPNVDVYSAKKGQNIFTNVAVSDVTDFIPVASYLTDSIYVRETGTTTDLAPLITITPNQKRSYTVVFRGRYGTTSGTTTSIRRYLSVFTTY
jgi:hypothetical protein